MKVVMKNITKSFQNKQVLNNVSLNVEDKEIVVLMGESGCGKTTLMRCLCDLEVPDSGLIQIDDQVLFDQALTKDKKTIKQWHKDVGMVFQNYHLFPHRTVLQNICDAVVYQKLMSKQAAQEQAMELLRQLNIEDKANDYPYVLSGGQKQRVAIARACILKPKVLCFDEPTSALDAKSIQQLVPIIQDLKQNMAIIIITHDEAFGEVVATRKVYMYDINKI